MDEFPPGNVRADEADLEWTRHVMSSRPPSSVVFGRIRLVARLDETNRSLASSISPKPSPASADDRLPPKETAAPADELRQIRAR